MEILEEVATEDHFEEEEEEEEELVQVAPPPMAQGAAAAGLGVFRDDTLPDEDVPVELAEAAEAERQDQMTAAVKRGAKPPVPPKKPATSGKKTIVVTPEVIL